jgi:hypothetical protein
LPRKSCVKGDSTTAVAREQLCGHVSPATREHAIMEETFSVRPVPRLYDEGELLLRDSLEAAIKIVGGLFEVQSVESCSCDK